MPRVGRAVAESGIYHIMLRGINRQVIFEDRDDNERFVDVIGFYKETCGFELLGYCLMANHAHILMRVGEEPLSTVFRRIASKYVYWYNAKYERIGHLFQERFKSEPVEDDAYLLAALRYIHRNPVKAGICAKADDYEFSSYRDYFGRAGVTDTSFVLGMMPADDLAAFTAQDNDDDCLEAEGAPRRRLADEAARGAMRGACGCSSASELQALGTEERDRCLAELLALGASVRQVSRITGIPVGVVRKLTPGRLAHNT